MERLFDIVRAQASKIPSNSMLASKAKNEWQSYDYKTCFEKSEAIASGLIHIGVRNPILEVERQTKIGIVSANRIEWLLVDLAVQMTGSILVPIYPTIAPQEFEYVLQESEVSVLFIADAELYHTFQPSFEKLPLLKRVFTFDIVDSVAHWEELLHSSDESERIREKVMDEITTNHIATLIYTSGTTGKPKGVMLSHKNILSNIFSTKSVFHFAQEGDKALSFLPLNHIFEKTISYIYLNAGVSIYYAQNMDTIGEDLMEVSPVVFTCVPRVLEKVYDKIMHKGYALNGIKRKLFMWAVAVANAYSDSMQLSFGYKLKLAIANKLIFSKWRAALGGNIKAVVSGAAALNPKFARIFTAAQIPIMEGYGLTETSPVISVNLFEQEGRRIGTVGLPIKDVQIKIAEDGEIMCKGPNVMVGYYKNKVQTDEVIDAEGWFATGDIGRIVEGKFLQITDRKKEIFKTSGGKYVAPQAVESTLRESKYIEQAIVIGPDRKFVAALIVPNFMQVQARFLAEGKMIPKSKTEIVQHPDVIALFQKELDRMNPALNHIEQIKKFVLIPTEWTVENGMLTPKLSMRRKLITEAFESEIITIYGEKEH